MNMNKTQHGHLDPSSVEMDDHSKYYKHPEIEEEMKEASLDEIKNSLNSDAGFVETVIKN